MKRSYIHLSLRLKYGDRVYKDMIVGEVKESESITNKVMSSSNTEGILEYVAPEGQYKITDVIATFKPAAEHDYIRIQS